MTKVTNNYNRDLGLPGGFVIGAGKAEDVPGWDKLSKHKVVAKWLESGVLSAGKSSKKDEPEDEPEVVEDVQFTEEVADESDEDARLQHHGHAGEHRAQDGIDGLHGVEEPEQDVVHSTRIRADRPGMLG